MRMVDARGEALRLWGTATSTKVFVQRGRKTPLYRVGAISNGRIIVEGNSDTGWASAFADAEYRLCHQRELPSLARLEALAAETAGLRTALLKACDMLGAQLDLRVRDGSLSLQDAFPLRARCAELRKLSGLRRDQEPQKDHA